MPSNLFTFPLFPILYFCLRLMAPLSSNAFQPVYLSNIFLLSFCLRLMAPLSSLFTSPLFLILFFCLRSMALLSSIIHYSLFILLFFCLRSLEPLSSLLTFHMFLLLFFCLRSMAPLSSRSGRRLRITNLSRNKKTVTKLPRCVKCTVQYDLGQGPKLTCQI